MREIQIVSSTPGEEASKKLTEGKGLAAYILMERIRPPVQTSTIIRNGELQVEGTLSELGIYGCFLACGKDVLLNETSGHLLRTKARLPQQLLLSFLTKYVMCTL